MKLETVLSALALVVSLTIAGYLWNERDVRPPLYSTVIDLVAHGSQYDGQRTAILGYATFRPTADDSRLYMSCEALLNRQRELSVRIVTLRDQFSREFLDNFQNRYVLIAGTIEYPLTLADIETIELIENAGVPECLNADE